MNDDITKNDDKRENDKREKSFKLYKHSEIHGFSTNAFFNSALVLLNVSLIDFQMFLR